MVLMLSAQNRTSAVTSKTEEPAADSKLEAMCRNFDKETKSSIYLCAHTGAWLHMTSFPHL